MRNITHRARNLLNLVQVIARPTEAHGSEDFVERVAAPIQALSAPRMCSFATNGMGARSRTWFAPILRSSTDLMGSRIDLHGPNLRLNTMAAQAIGLAVHWLATNAGKYRALSADAGRFGLSWKVEGNTLTMSWTERGGPPVSAPQRYGFGSQQ
jgi:two-component sensor histidine kinase